MSNDSGLVFKLAQEYGDDFLVLVTKKTKKQVDILKRRKINFLYFDRIAMVFKNDISYLKNADLIICDDYLAELSILKPRKVIQLWHAGGAIKNFGLKAANSLTRPLLDRKRFLKVYDSYTDILSNSEQMSQIFISSWGVDNNVIREIGFLKNDYLLHRIMTKDAQTISFLYVPTYRDNVDDFKKVLNSALQTFARFKDETFTVKLHPSLLSDIDIDIPDNVVFLKNGFLRKLINVEVLITDYSSLVFDYTLIRKNPRVIFFCPDLDEYKKDPGLQDGFLDWSIGPIARNTSDFAKYLSEGRVLDYSDEMIQFKKKWHQYSDGKTSERVLQLISEKLKEN